MVLSLTNDDCHAVLIYSMDNENFKIKDSHGEKYEIPISRPDSLQVKISFKYIIPEYLSFAIGKAYAASWIT